jgi:uncharacterized protein YbaP (TraB family)
MSETKEPETKLITEEQYMDRLRKAWEKYDAAHRVVMEAHNAETAVLTTTYNEAMEPFRAKRKAALEPLVEEYQRDIDAAKAAFGDQPRTIVDTTT